MAIFIEQADYDFLLSSERFCSGIDKYISLLDLDLSEINKFKEDAAVLMYVFNNAAKYPSYAENFLHYKTQVMRPVYHRLTLACTESENYCIAIGHELWIENPVLVFSYN